MLLLLANCFLVGFLGYAIGRIGHIYLGKTDGPHHWIYGALMFVPGLYVFNLYIFLLFAFGMGLIISDLKDFLELKIWGVDDVEVLKFWHID